MVDMPFKNNVSVRLTGKDNFVPCVYKLNDDTLDTGDVSNNM